MVSGGCKDDEVSTRVQVGAEFKSNIKLFVLQPEAVSRVGWVDSDLSLGHWKTPM